MYLGANNDIGVVTHRIINDGICWIQSNGMTLHVSSYIVVVRYTVRCVLFLDFNGNGVIEGGLHKISVPLQPLVKIGLNYEGGTTFNYGKRNRCNSAASLQTSAILSTVFIHSIRMILTDC